MSRDPSDELNDPPGRKHHEAYERHHRELPKEESGFVAIDPVKWKPVRFGLTLVFCGSVTILAAMAFFAAFWLANVFILKKNLEVVRLVEAAAAAIAGAGGLLTFAGQCVCVVVPREAGARWLLLGSIAGALGTVAAGVLLYFGTSESPAAAENPQVEAKNAPSAEAPPKEEIPAAKDEAPPAGEATPGEQAVFQPLPPTTIGIPRRSKLWILPPYVIGHILFVFFLRRVARFFHDIFLAESTGGYMTFLITLAAIVTALPPQALVACFTWAIMLGLDLVLMSWFLLLVWRTRKVIV